MPLTAHGEQSALRSHRTPNTAASTASRPAFVTIAIRPSVERDSDSSRFDLGQREQIFSENPKEKTRQPCHPTGKSQRGRDFIYATQREGAPCGSLFHPAGSVPQGRYRTRNDGESANQFTRISALIISAAFSPIMMVGALVLPPIRVGMTEASTMRRPSSP